MHTKVIVIAACLVMLTVRDGRADSHFAQELKELHREYESGALDTIQYSKRRTAIIRDAAAYYWKVFIDKFKVILREFRRIFRIPRRRECAQPPYVKDLNELKKEYGAGTIGFGEYMGRRRALVREGIRYYCDRIFGTFRDVFMKVLEFLKRLFERGILPIQNQ